MSVLRVTLYTVCVCVCVCVTVCRSSWLWLSFRYTCRWGALRNYRSWQKQRWRFVGQLMCVIPSNHYYTGEAVMVSGNAAYRVRLWCHRTQNVTVYIRVNQCMLIVFLHGIVIAESCVLFKWEIWPHKTQKQNFLSVHMTSRTQLTINAIQQMKY